MAVQSRRVSSPNYSRVHDYYDPHQYLPPVITCAENDQVLNVGLLCGSAHPALGADEDLDYVVSRLRQARIDLASC